MNNKKMKSLKSSFRCYIFLIIFIGGGLSLMVFGGQATNSVRIDRDVTIEQPKKMEKIVYKFKPIDLEFKLLVY